MISTRAISAALVVLGLACVGPEAPPPPPSPRAGRAAVAEDRPAAPRPVDDEPTRQGAPPGAPPSASAEADQGAPTGAAAAPPGEAPQSLEPITVQVPGDNPLEVVLGPLDSPRVIVYLHGVCGDPFAFAPWTEAAVSHATFVSMRGDQACKRRPGRFKWSFDYDGLNSRIDEAIDAVEELRTERWPNGTLTPIERDEVVLIGYSQGAHRVQWMAARFPDRYRRVALIAMANEPSRQRLAHAERVLLMAGGWDARTHIRAGHHALKKAGVTVKYLELPKARHGEYGPEANATMSAALEWLFK